MGLAEIAVLLGGIAVLGIFFMLVSLRSVAKRPDNSLLQAPTSNFERLAQAEVDIRALSQRLATLESNSDSRHASLTTQIARLKGRKVDELEGMQQLLQMTGSMPVAAAEEEEEPEPAGTVRRPVVVKGTRRA